MKLVSRFEKTKQDFQAVEGRRLLIVKEEQKKNENEDEELGMRRWR